MEVFNVSMYSEIPDDKGELFTYQFTVNEGGEGELEVTEALIVADKYRQDPDINKSINKVVREYGLAPAIKRQFVSFGVEHYIDDNPIKQSDAYKAIEQAANVVKGAIECLGKEK